MKMVALIPARAGSKRIPGKNTRLLGGRQLIAWTIQAALDSGVFERVIVSTEDQATGLIAVNLGAQLQARPACFATDASPDIDWVRNVFETPSTLLRGGPVKSDAFAILRPTSPFRTAETIQRAYKQFSHDEAHSLRAMQPVKEHPGKMWQVYFPGYPAVPLIGDEWPAPGGVPFRTRQPWHSQPTQTLPTVYIQNASLEMAWSYVLPAFGTISGRKVAPFFTEGYEGVNLDYEEDWTRAEDLIARGLVTLPHVGTSVLGKG